MESELPWLDPEYLSEDDSVLDYFNYRTHFRDKRRRFDNDKVRLFPNISSGNYLI